MVQAEVAIAIDDLRLSGLLRVPSGARGTVVFAHGSGSGRFSQRNRYVASHLHEAGFSTLLFDLLTEEEEQRERYTRHLRFDIALLAQRLLGATRWLRAESDFAQRPLAYFGASTGAGAALVAAARAAIDGIPVAAVVSRGGRPDLAGDALPYVRAPTRLIVGSEDRAVIELNRSALQQLRCEKQLDIVPNAGHLFEEPGALEQVARLAADWFGRYAPLEEDA